MISLKTVQQISVKTDKQFSKNRDFIFHLFYSEVYNYIVDANLSFIHVQNDRSINMMISRHACLSLVIKYKKESCYAESIENLKLTVLLRCNLNQVNMSEICLSNSITIYSTPDNIAAIADVMKTYSDL